MEAVMAMRTTLKKRKNALICATPIVRKVDNNYDNGYCSTSQQSMTLCFEHIMLFLGCPPYCTPDYCEAKETRKALCTM